MKNFKDFIYDKSDIIVALAILLVAALVIAWRLGAIVEYPKDVIDKNNNTTTITTDAPSQDDTAKDDNKTDDKPDTPPVDNTDSNSVWGSNGLLTKDVTVNWSGSYAGEIIQCAINAGLFEDYNDYKTYCLNNGISDPDNIPWSESSTFAAGSSKASIVLQIHNKH